MSALFNIYFLKKSLALVQFILLCVTNDGKSKLQLYLRTSRLVYILLLFVSKSKNGYK